MKKAFTIIELLVIVAVVSLFLAMLAPMAARAKQEDLKVTCKANLGTIGRALTMYANANDGYAPEISAHIFRMLNDKPRHELLGPGRLPVPGRDRDLAMWNSMCSLSAQNLTIGNAQIWQCSQKRPSRPVMLGLLWSGGYLKGNSKNLYCPSNKSGKWAVGRKRDRNQSYDADEPFWTSGAKVTRGDNDGLGDGHGAWGMYYHSCYDGAKAVSPGICNVLTNYSYRIFKKGCKRSFNSVSTFYPTAGKLAEVQKMGIVTDTLDPWLGSNKNPPARNNNTIPSPECYKVLRNCAVSNHGSSYNVLYADGSVNNYSEGDFVFNMICDIWQTQQRDKSRDFTVVGYHLDTKNLTENVWEEFFDAEYNE